MDLFTFFEKFNQFADAPDAVPKLRELVLLLSVRGKLSEQSRAESCELQLAAASAFAHRRGKTFESDALDAPFSIPENWGWVAVGHAMNLVNGTAFKPENWTPDGTPIVRIQNLNNPDAPFNRFNGQIESKFYIDSGEFLISWSGTPGTSFGAFIWNRGRAILNQHIFRCELVDGVFVKEYLRLAVNARLDEMISRAHGAVGLRHITKGKLETIPLPLPPLAEQKRIVAKVDELMALCDRLERQQQERETRQGGLARASLTRFVEAPTPANLDFLFHPSYAIPPADLRKALLTLAVQGKLVPQDPNDEPAEQVLARIAATKLRLQKTGEIGKEKPVEPLQPDSLPFEAPDSWQWAKLAEITELITKGSSPKWQGIAYVSESEGILFITSENVGNYVLRKLHDLKYVSKGFNEIEPRSILKRGDILMNLVGASIGRTAVYDLHDGANINQAVALIRLVRETDGVCPRFLLHYLNSPSAIDYMLSSRVVNAQPNISLTDAREFAVPIPPLAEQRRIVAKVEQLMALVDALETQLAASRATAAKLLAALVAELTLA